MSKKKIFFGLKMAKIGFERSRFYKKRVGAAYVEGSKIIIGSNSLKTTPISKLLGTHWERTHAEMDVLRHIHDGSKGTLFLFRQKADGTLGMSRPCNSCMVLLKQKNIKRIVFTTEEGIGKETLV